MKSTSISRLLKRRPCSSAKHPPDIRSQQRLNSLIQTIKFRDKAIRISVEVLRHLAVTMMVAFWVQMGIVLFYFARTRSKYELPRLVSRYFHPDESSSQHYQMISAHTSKADRQAGRQAGRKTDRRADRQAGRQTGRRTGRQAGRTIAVVALGSISSTRLHVPSF